MTEHHEDDWLDARLRDEAPYLDDTGFTARVMGQLPPRRRQSPWLRAAILVGITFIASVLAYVVSGGGVFLADAAAFVVAMPTLTVCALALCCGVLVTALGGYAAAKAQQQHS